MDRFWTLGLIEASLLMRLVMVAFLFVSLVFASDNLCVTKRLSDGPAEVQFCLRDRVQMGNCSGGVFHGLLKCVSSSETLCKSRYNISPLVAIPVVVKYNEVGSEVRRDLPGKPGFYIPASSTEHEIEAIEKMKDIPETVKLLGKIGTPGEQSQIGNQRFWEPGMVMERIEYPTWEMYVQNNFLWNEYASGDINGLKRVARAMRCINRRLARYADQMLHRGIFHHDMHWKNVMVRQSPEGICEDIKVIDFGILLTITSPNDSKLLSAAVDLSYRYDGVMKDVVKTLQKKAKSSQVAQHTLDLRKQIAPVSYERTLLGKLISAAQYSSKNELEARHFCRHTGHQKFSQCSVLKRYMNIKRFNGAALLNTLVDNISNLKWVVNTAFDETMCFKALNDAKFCINSAATQESFTGMLTCTAGSCRTRPARLKLYAYDPEKILSQEKPFRKLLTDREVPLPAWDIEREIEVMYKSNAVSGALHLLSVLRDHRDAELIDLPSSSTYMLPGLVLEPLGPGAFFDYALNSNSFWTRVPGDGGQFLRCLVSETLQILTDLYRSPKVVLNNLIPGNLRILKVKNGDCFKIQVVDFKYATVEEDDRVAFARICRDIDDLMTAFLNVAQTRLTSVTSRGVVQDVFAGIVVDLKSRYNELIVSDNCGGYEKLPGSCCQAMVP